MPGARYRIDSLTIEGFKAFGVQQDVAFSGKHCFLFGANARGKSSVVEAIRWCLFGLESRPDSDVRNRFHEAADCRVELRLRDAAGLWRVDRRLRPGQLRSDLTIRNPDGKEVAQKEALPNLVRLGSGGGAVVFFSAQQAARARAYGDLTRFHEVLYAHLNLVDAERFRSDLDDLLEKQLELVRQRAEGLQSAEDKLRTRLKEVDAHLDEILRNPPWQPDEPPTRPLSETRVRAFVADLAGEFGAAADAAWDCPTALEHAEKWVRELSGTRQATLDRSAASEKSEHTRLSVQLAVIRRANEREAEEHARALELDHNLVELCEGAGPEGLEARWKAASARLDQEGRSALARKAVTPLLGPHARECPICGLPCDGAELWVFVKSCGWL